MPATWRPYNTYSRWNVPIGTEQRKRIDPNSDAICDQYARDQYDTKNARPKVAFSATDPFSHPVYWAKDTDPVYTVRLTEDWGTTTQGHRIHIPSYALPEGLQIGYPEADGHLAVIQPGGWEYDFWETSWPPVGGTITARFGGRTRMDGMGLNAYATGLGDGLAGGNITGAELFAGRIRHALFAIAAKTNGERHNGCWSRMNATEGLTNYPAAGQRFTLDMTMAQIDFEFGAYPVWERALLKALRHWGFYVGDTGGGLFKLESQLPYVRVGQRPPALNVMSSGNFYPRIPWDRMVALVP